MTFAGAIRRHPRVIATLAVLASLGGWAMAGPTSPALAATASRSRTPDTVTAFDQLKGTGTILAWDATTLAHWKAAGVTVAPAGTATAVDRGAEAHLPITSGYLESHSDRSFKPKPLLGSIEHFGSGLAFASSSTSTSVEVTDLVFDLGESTVWGTIGSTENIPMFSLQQADVRVARSGHTLQIEGAQLDLSSTGASELDAFFHTSAITPNTEIADVRITATGPVSRYTYTEQTAEFPRLSGIALSVTFTARTLALFAGLGLSPSPTGSASYNTQRAEVSFPVTGGTAVVHPNRNGMPGTLEGVVLGWGTGLALSRGSTSVAMTDLTLVPTNSTIYASVNGGADDGAVFSVRHATRITLAGGNLDLQGATLDLTAGGAAMLNQAFGTSEFSGGAELGKLTLVASGG